MRKETDAAPLAVFRILFGAMMFMSMVRFWSNGWIEKLYIAPSFFFSYYGFEWIKPFGSYTYVLFVLCACSAVMVALGYRYRLAIVLFFLSFTYIELMDKTTYLNHYYFISALSFLMIFLPASACFSLDSRKEGSFARVPAWTVDSIKLLIAIVYVYAGLAKLNSEWLIHAMPLKIWLPGKYDLPVLGALLHKEWVIYAFSWVGALYDLLIPFFLLMKRTRIMAFVAVVVFHVMTAALFPIGMFPYIMIVNAFIFFDPALHRKAVDKLSRFLGAESTPARDRCYTFPFHYQKKLTFTVIVVFFAAQLLVPWRYLLYKGELFWTEEGYRFSWRVMLMEKAGYASFKIVNPENGTSFYVRNDDFLTTFQEKQMSTQPDFMLEYAHFLADRFQSKGHGEVEVYVDSYVALNGRRSRPYIDPSVNLAREKRSFSRKTWILPFNDEIKGI